MRHNDYTLNLKYLSTLYLRSGRDKLKIINASDTETVRRECPICHSRLYPYVSSLSNSGIDILVKSICYKCSLSTFSKLPKQTWFKDYYKSVWDQKRDKQQIEHKINTFSETLNGLLQKVVKSKKDYILDIGAGYAGDLKKLNDMGYDNLYGIEASKKRQEILRK